MDIWIGWNEKKSETVELFKTTEQGTENFNFKNINTKFGQTKNKTTYEIGTILNLRNAIRLGIAFCKLFIIEV